MSLPPSPYVDAAFPLRGAAIPIDHGYPLFAALCRRWPPLHQKPHWSIHPIRGHYAGKGQLELTRHSRVKLRLPGDELGQIIPLAGATLDIDGSTHSLGAPQLLPIITAPFLKARIVVIKGFTDDPQAFLEALQRQLGQLDGLGQPPETIDITLGPRRALHIKGVPHRGYAVALAGLGADASLAIQCHGLGGRLHMGAGVFVPPARGG